MIGGFLAMLKAVGELQYPWLLRTGRTFAWVAMGLMGSDQSFCRWFPLHF